MMFSWDRTGREFKDLCWSRAGAFTDEKSQGYGLSGFSGNSCSKHYSTTQPLRT